MHLSYYAPKRRGEGIEMPITLSFPIASTAMAAVSEESMPPLRPMSAFEKLDF